MSGPRILAEADPHAVDAVVEALRAGGVVVLPTDTVYGVAVLPGRGTTKRLFELKRRPARQSIALLVAGLEQAREVAEVPDELARVLGACWPGPLTVVLRRRPGLDFELGGDETTVGVRCPNHDFVRRVASGAGPIATTSANVSGQPTPPRLPEVLEALGGGVDVAVDGGELAGVPSTVVDLTTVPARVTRQGGFDVERLCALGLGIGSRGHG